MSEKPQDEQLSGKVVCDGWWHGDDPHHGSADCLRPCHAQPQVPAKTCEHGRYSECPFCAAPSLDARGDLSETEIAGLEVGLSMPSAQFATVNEYARRLIAEVKRRRAAPSAPSDALREALERALKTLSKWAAAWSERDRHTAIMMRVEAGEETRALLELDPAVLAASPSVTREQEWRSPECNYQLREILTLAWDHVNPIAAKFRKDILAAREHFAPLPAPTAPKEPQQR